MKRPVVVVLGLAVAGLVMLAWTQTWFTVHLAASSAVAPTVDADGAATVPQYTALAIASLALFLALTIAGRVLRTVLGVVQVLLGVAVVVTGVDALRDPVAAARGAIGGVAGVSDLHAVRGVVTSVDTSVWPAVGIVGGVLAAALGVLVLVVQGRWAGPSRKYATTAEASSSRAAGPRDTVLDWDDLSAGSDPTSGTARTGAEEAAATAGSPPDQQVGLDQRHPSGDATDHEEHREQH